jgi:hypothetical protein
LAVGGEAVLRVPKAARDGVDRTTHDSCRGDGPARDSGDLSNRVRDLPDLVRSRETRAIADAARDAVELAQGSFCDLPRLCCVGQSRSPLARAVDQAASLVHPLTRLACGAFCLAGCVFGSFSGLAQIVVVDHVCPRSLMSCVACVEGWRW